MPLEEQVALDVEEALRGIDSIEQALGSATQSFKVGLADALDLLSSVAIGDVDASSVTAGIDAAVSAADTTAEVQVDAESVTSSIDQAVATADTTISIDAITDAVTDEIEQAVQAADTTITPEVDTSQLNQLKQSSEAGGEGLVDLAGKAALLKDALGGATGEGAAATSVLAKLGPEGVAAAAGIGAVSGIIAEFTKEAAFAQAATQRFDSLLGPFAEDVRHIDVGGLNVDLEKLANSLGDTDAEVEQAAGNFAQLGIASGRSREQIAGSTEQLIALAASISAFNPALGTTADVLERLPQALARGGRFAANYGLDLDKAAIAARAVANAHGDASAATDQFALREAGLQLALEQIPDLEGRIADGLDKPIIKLRAFEAAQREAREEAGQNFLKPLTDAAHALELPLSQLIRLVGVSLGAALRIAEVGLAPIVPLLDLAGAAADKFASAIVFLENELTNLASGPINFAKNGISGLIGLFNDIPVLPDIGDPFDKGTKSERDFIAGAGEVGNVLDQIFGSESQGKVISFFDAQSANVDAAEGLAAAQRSVRNATEAVGDAANTTAKKTKSETERVLELRAAELGVESAQSQLEDSADSLAEAQDKLAHIYDVTAEEAKRIEAAQRSLQSAQQDYRDATDRVTESQQKLLDVTRAATEAEADKARRDVARARLNEADAKDRLEDAQKLLAAAQLTAQRAASRSPAVQAAAAENLSDKQRELERAELDVADATASRSEAQAKAADVLDGTIGTTKEITDAHKELDAAQRAQAEAAQRVTDAESELDDAQKATTVSAKDLHDAQRDVERAQLAHEQAALSVDQAEAQLAKTQSGEADASGSAANAARALRNAHEQLADTYVRTLLPAMIAAKDAEDALDGTQVTAKEHAQNQIDAYRQLAQQVGNDSPLGQHLNETADKLQTDFDRTYTVQVDADTKKLDDKLEALRLRLNEIFVPLGVPELPPLPGLMAGTWDWPGGFATVGERGAETVFLPAGSAVVPNNQRDQFADGMGGGNITIIVNEVAADPEATAFAVSSRLGQESFR